MNKYSFLILLSFLFCFSCDVFDGPANSCSVSDPINDLPWLNTMKEGYISEYNYIGQATYEGETVFYFASCCPLCNWALKSYNCSGEKIEESHTLEDLKNKKVIWKAEDSKCTFD